MTRQSKTQTQQQTPTTNSLSKGGILQRKCEGCGQHTIASNRCSECEKQQLPLQRRATNQSELEEVPSIVHEVLSSSGQALDTETRAFIEPRFRYDFSSVRVHTDAKAAESAQAVSAAAYTVGDHIVFGSGKYTPTTNTGRQLLAHELSHVIQQAGARGAALTGKSSTMLQASKVGSSIAIGSSNDAAEQEADRLAEMVMRDNPHTSFMQPREVVFSSSTMLQRQPQGQAAAGEVSPLVQKFIKGEASQKEKDMLQQQLLSGKLSPSDVEALKKPIADQFRDALAKMLPPLTGKQGQIKINPGSEVKDVHTFFKAGLRVRLSGAPKVLAGGLEGSVETVVEVNAVKDPKKVTVTITPPSGDTSLAALIRAKAFPHGPLVIELGEGFLKALNMISIQGDLSFTITGSKENVAGGLVIRSPEIPAGVELQVTLTQSTQKPPVAPSTGAPVLPPPRVFATVGGGTASSKPVGTTTLGFDLPLFTDTKNPLIYGGLGLRTGIDTRGTLTGGGAIFTGLHLSPITVQLALGAGYTVRQPSDSSDRKGSAYFGAEASISYQVLQHVEIMALASVIGDNKAPAASTIQLGAGLKF
jgi:hypothetical protein